MKSRRTLAVVFASLIAVAQTLPVHVRAQTRASEHWVSTWATAQQIMPAPVRTPPSFPNRQAAPPPQQPGTSAPRGGFRPVALEIPASLADQTIRMVVRSSIGGRRVRISLSNMQGAQPLSIGAAHLALA